MSRFIWASLKGPKQSCGESSLNLRGSRSGDKSKRAADGGQGAKRIIGLGIESGK
jgi:hypothetical protein